MLSPTVLRLHAEDTPFSHPKLEHDASRNSDPDPERIGYVAGIVFYIALQGMEVESKELPLRFASASDATALS